MLVLNNVVYLFTDLRSFMLNQNKKRSYGSYYVIKLFF